MDPMISATHPIVIVDRLHSEESTERSAETLRERFVYSTFKSIQDSTDKESFSYFALSTMKTLSDLVENLVLLYFVNDKFTNMSGLIFGIFVLFDFLDRIFSLFGFTGFLIRLVFEKASAEELHELTFGIILLANFFISRILLEFVQGIIYMYLTGFEQDTCVIFAAMFVLQAFAIIAENAPDQEGGLNLKRDGLSSFYSATSLLVKTSVGAIMLIPQLCFSDQYNVFFLGAYQVCLTISIWSMNSVFENYFYDYSWMAFIGVMWRPICVETFLVGNFVLVMIKILNRQDDSDLVLSYFFLVCITGSGVAISQIVSNY